MCVLTNLGEMGGDMPVYACDGCDVQFSICWQRNGVYDTFEYCPFCGDEIEDVISEEEEEFDDD